MKRFIFGKEMYKENRGKITNEISLVLCVNPTPKTSMSNKNNDCYR